MPKGSNAGKGGGARKIERNKNDCLAYRNSQKHEMSHARKLYAHIVRGGFTDGRAINQFNSISPLVRSKAKLPLANLRNEPPRRGHPARIPMPRHAPTPKLSTIEPSFKTTIS
jgi:hypothetical protein